MPTISINFAYKLQAFWQEWNIRIFVLLSQFLQLLIYMALPYRRCISNSSILFLINGTYEVSFTVAGMAVACISSGMPDQKGYQPPLVLWASFMLLHLSGGGYTTAQTLDDYEKWYQHFFNFLFHDLVMFFVIWFQWRQVSVPGSWAFILALAYFFGMKQLINLRRSRIGYSRREQVEELTNEKRTADEVSKVLKYYHSSKKVIRGLRLTTTRRQQIRRDFLNLDAETAVWIVERELNYTYSAYFIRGVDPPKDSHLLVRMAVVDLFVDAGVAAMLIALGIKISFLSSALEDKYKVTDILITRILCFCTVFSYFISLLPKLSMFYAIAGGRRIKSFLRSLLASVLDHIFPLPWSRTISRRSFMTECFIEAAMSRNSLINIFRRWYVTPSTPGSQSYNDDIGKFIFTNLHKKATSSEAEDDSHRVFENQFTQVLPDQLPSHRKQLEDWFLRWPYDMWLLRWHIATEILYNTSDCNQPAGNECRQMSNLLSEYLMHLTFERGHIMSRFQGNLDISYRDTSNYIRHKEEFEKWCRWGRPPLKDQLEKPTLKEQLELFYEMITHEKKDAPVTNQGKKEKEKENKEISQPPVVRDAVKIAQVLKESLQDRNVLWEVISEVWVDMLVYAATHCDPMAHVEKLAEGGELITIVWLLSVHLGFGDFFLPKEETENPEDA